MPGDSARDRFGGISSDPGGSAAGAVLSGSAFTTSPMACASGPTSKTPRIGVDESEEGLQYPVRPLRTRICHDISFCPHGIQLAFDGRAEMEPRTAGAVPRQWVIHPGVSPAH